MQLGIGQRISIVWLSSSLGNCIVWLESSMGIIIVRLVICPKVIIVWLGRGPGISVGLSGLSLWYRRRNHSQGRDKLQQVE